MSRLLSIIVSDVLKYVDNIMPLEITSVVLVNVIVELFSVTLLMQVIGLDTCSYKNELYRIESVTAYFNLYMPTFRH